MDLKVKYGLIYILLADLFASQFFRLVSKVFFIHRVW